MIDVSNLRCIGCGSFASVYQLSPTRVVKVYDQNHERRGDRVTGRIVGEEVRMSRTSPHALPVLRVVVVMKTSPSSKRTTYHYGLIKRYLPQLATYKESEDLRLILPRKLRADCGGSNVRKDADGRVYLIDTQGPYGISRC